MIDFNRIWQQLNAILNEYISTTGGSLQKRQPSQDTPFHREETSSTAERAYNQISIYSATTSARLAISPFRPHDNPAIIMIQYIRFPFHYPQQNSQPMENYEAFWNSSLTGQGQLVLDWDSFIESFSRSIAQLAHYELNATQRQFIKSKIDPQQRNEIYKNAFLLFAKHYWDVPSNRTNLFKMKINLTNALPRLNLMTASAVQQINIALTYKAEMGEMKRVRFQFSCDQVRAIDGDGYAFIEKRVRESGFVSIGAAESSDIVVADCLFVGKELLKIISVGGEKKAKKANYYDQTPPKPVFFTQWFFRDVSRSNRLKYLLDSPYKYVFLKPQMRLTLGLTEDIEMKIEKIGFSAADYGVSQMQENQIVNLLNADRINFMGEIDPKVPLKTVLNFDFQEVSPREIDELFRQGQYYPDAREETSEKKGKEEKDAPSLTFEIYNKRSCLRSTHTAYDTAFAIGRAAKCNFRIEDIGVRSRELLFSCVGGAWIVSNPDPSRASLDSNVPAVYVASSRNMDEHRHSGRVALREGYPYTLRGRQFDLQVELKEPKIDEQD